ncbi:hypothetical protein HDU91_002614, partial [Kappamyces sp. JEL0680]
MNNITCQLEFLLLVASLFITTSTVLQVWNTQLSSLPLATYGWSSVLFWFIQSRLVYISVHTPEGNFSLDLMGYAIFKTGVQYSTITAVVLLLELAVKSSGVANSVPDFLDTTDSKYTFGWEGNSKFFHVYVNVMAIFSGEPMNLYAIGTLFLVKYHWWGANFIMFFALVTFHFKGRGKLALIYAVIFCFSMLSFVGNAVYLAGALGSYLSYSTALIKSRAKKLLFQILTAGLGLVFLIDSPFGTWIDSVFRNRNVIEPQDNFVLLSDILSCFFLVMAGDIHTPTYGVLMQPIRMVSKLALGIT